MRFVIEHNAGSILLPLPLPKDFQRKRLFHFQFRQNHGVFGGVNWKAEPTQAFLDRTTLNSVSTVQISK